MADQFSSDHGFENKQDLFRRAALLSQRPNEAEDIPELTEEDKYCIRREKTSKYWAVPFGSVSWIFFCLDGVLDFIVIEKNQTMAIGHRRPFLIKPNVLC